jgi:hypothetical protein
MATLHYSDLSLEIGYHSLSKNNIINYYLRVRWKEQPLFNQQICSNNMDEDSFLFTLDSFEPEDVLVSFFEKFTSNKKDTHLYNWVEPDVKFQFYTWSGRLPFLKHKYGDTINVGAGVESFETGTKRLEERTGDHVEIVIRIPNYHLMNGSPARENWINSQYIILGFQTFFQAIEAFTASLRDEFVQFKEKYPIVQEVEFSDPWT